MAILVLEKYRNIFKGKDETFFKGNDDIFKGNYETF